MKNLLISLILIVNCFITVGQTSPFNSDSIAKYGYGSEFIDFKVSINENNELQFVKVVDSLKSSKEDLYTKVLSYFAYYYKDANNILQQQDKENGVVIAKGLFGNISNFKKTESSGLIPITMFFDYDAKHTVRVDIKDGKVRYILTVSDYQIDVITVSSSSMESHSTRQVSKCAPIFADYSEYENAKYIKKTVKKWVDIRIGSEKKAFYDLCQRCRQSIITFEKSIREGVINAEKENW